MHHMRLLYQSISRGHKRLRIGCRRIQRTSEMENGIETSESQTKIGAAFFQWNGIRKKRTNAVG